MHDELAEYLDALKRDECYRVDATLKENPHETTERVFFVGANGSESGPYIRKRFHVDSGLGQAYERIWQAQKKGERYLHIPRIIDCYSVDDAHVVVMECINGSTLADIVYLHDASLNLAHYLFPKLCDAVTELHESFNPPIIHRDLKPSNIMIENNNLILIDFGIARTFDENATHDTAAFGTRNYAPPEQFGFGQTDKRSDVYALGMILYYCLTEKSPEASLVENGFAVDNIPESLRPVLVKATALDPSSRYQNAQELKDAFLMAVEKTPRSFLSKIPQWVGVIWNVILALIWVFFICVAFIITFSPTEPVAQYPLLVRAIIYFGILLVGFGLLLYLLADKRRLRKRISLIADLTWKQELPFCVGVTIAIFAASVLLAGIFG